ncbi:hypothetical protein HOLleu_18013 [Holothuria leucospilota]|uniref:Uncharacterized protein n=1 Tax=Holothuria leucospilota TaxID=206669 RepID=A0A9Q1H9A1_HOLLE|nr:hypothetical protein HOLleu_18013 [Holothuria leucospilota]
MRNFSCRTINGFRHLQLGRGWVVLLLCDSSSTSSACSNKKYLITLILLQG